MGKATTVTSVLRVDLSAFVGLVWEEVGASFERFCLLAGISTLAEMMEDDARAPCGPRYGCERGKSGHR
jgi:hypothetical protein